MLELTSLVTYTRKLLSKKVVLIGLLLISGFFATRLINLDTNVPIFSDEGIYIRWARIAAQDGEWRFISLTDGKQPLQTWGSMPFMKLNKENLLLGGRLFSVATGFFGLIGMTVLCGYLWGKKGAFFGALFYIVTPYFVFYDRMALVDSGVNAFFIWILFLSLLLARTMRLDVALVFGLLAGVGTLAKSTVTLFLALSGLAFITSLKNFKFNSPNIKHAINYVFLFGISAVLALGIYQVQRLSQFYHVIAEKNTTFILTPAEFLANPFQVFFNNIKIVPLYVSWELGFIPVAAAILGIYFLWKKDSKLALYMSAFLVAPFLLVVFFNEVVFPRYLIFFGGLLTVWSVYFFVWLFERFNRYPKKLFVVATVYSFILLCFSAPMVFKAQAISFPPVDRGQYVEGVTAVWGARELVEYVRASTSDKPAIIIAEGNFGLVGDVLETFIKPNDKIRIAGYWPLDENKLAEHQKDLNTSHVYAVFAQRESFPAHWPIKLIKKYEKPVGENSLYLYELTEALQ